MSAQETVFTSEALLEVFPPERTEAFFEALFGGAEDGAYDIRLVMLRDDNTRLEFGFELHQRPGMCLACNLTSGLPAVFARHPIINIRDVTARLAALAGWTEGTYTWELGETDQVSPALHIVPLAMRCV